MPLAARHQLSCAIEDFPGTQKTAIANDVIDFLSASFAQSRTLISRQPASNSLSPAKESVGRGEATANGDADLKGSGTAITAPDWGRLLRSGLMMEVDVFELEFLGNTTLAVRVGDIISNNIAGEVAAVVVEDTASAQANVKVVMITSGAFGQSTAVFRIRGYDSAGAKVATAMGSTDAIDETGSVVGKAYKPTSQHEMTFAITGAWGIVPADGSNIQVTSGGVVVGEVMHISSTASVVTCEPLWGDIPASATLTSTEGYTATVHATPALTQTQGLRLSVESNRDRLMRALIGACTNYTLTADAGASARFAFDFTGKAATPSDQAHISGAAFSSATPPRFTGDDGNMYVDGIALPFKSYSHTIGNQISLSPNANESEGDAYAQVTGRDPDLSLNVDQLGKGGFDWWLKWKNAHPVQVGMKAGTTAGNTLVFCATSAQIDGVSDDDTDGIATHTIATKLRKYTADGDNEFVIAHI